MTIRIKPLVNYNNSIIEANFVEFEQLYSELLAKVLMNVNFTEHEEMFLEVITLISSMRLGYFRGDSILSMYLGDQKLDKLIIGSNIFNL